MGRPPLRIDIMMSIPGIKFNGAWKNRVVVEFGELKLFFISQSDLIKSKEASGRPQDKIDVEKLKEAERIRSDCASAASHNLDRLSDKPGLL